jgi:hypothetical protein
VASDPTRRAVVAAAAALPLLIAGCKGTQALGTPPGPAPDVARLRGAIRAEQDLVASYQAMLGRPGAGHGSEHAILTAVLTEHQDHLHQLRARLIPGSPRAAGSAPQSGPQAGARAAALPADPRQALGELLRAERAASDRLLSQVPEVPPALAQLFASISASEATHVLALHAAGAA